jgi:hypothetical protein
MYDSVLGHIQTTLDLDIPDNIHTGYPVKLDITNTYIAAEVSGEYVLVGYVDADYAETGTAEAHRTFIDLPWDNALIVQGTGCATPGQTVITIITDLGTGMYRYLLDDTTVPDGSSIIAGLGYESLVKPTMPFIRDANGSAIKNSKLVITELVIYYDDSGIINTRMDSKYRADPIEHSNLQIVTANDPDDPEGKGIRSGSYNVPWGERSDWSELTIASDDVRPMTILEVEWIGQILSRGRRA